ncbi:MAG: UDP-N-acetylglucosamine--N-acetylmuramyl-(pentapeptide) pyrophosphoryl-undecaprenol N-acetylglucosamine transferase [Chloroflexota bacterium]
MYPALSVLSALKKIESALKVLWVGGAGGMEEDLVKRADISFTAVPAAGVHGVGLRRLPRNVISLARGFFAARSILCDYRPDLLFFTGGYVAVPVALAGRRLPKLLYTPDIEPALALKTISYMADRIMVTTEDSRVYYSRPESVVVSGYPARSELTGWTVDAARQALDLREDMPTLLVMGGSQGARSINLAMLNALEELLADIQIVHISGQLDWTRVEAAQGRLPVELHSRYRPYKYLHEEMGAAFRVADLVISRAGASTLGELPLFGLPAVLVPYPHAWRYQHVNAQFLVERGAAVVINDHELVDTLIPTIRSLLTDKDRLDGMKQAMRALACPHAAETIAHNILDLAMTSCRKRM